MNVTIDRYTVKSLIREAYHINRNLKYVTLFTKDNLFRHDCRSRHLNESKEMDEAYITEFMAEFEKLMPFIQEQFDCLEAEHKKSEVISSINAATARGIIAEMVSNGLIDILPHYSVRGMDNGRVEIRFQSPKCTMNTPLDHLRARLRRRFGNNK